MRTVIKLLLFLSLSIAILLSLGSCESKSGQRTKQVETGLSFDEVRVKYDTLYFTLVNDSIAIRKLNRAIFYRAKDKVSGRNRFYEAI